MNIRHLQGWALVSSAFVMGVLLVFNTVGSTSGIPYVGDILIIMYTTFFMVGLPGIQSVQPQTKIWGNIGLFLMLIPPLDKLLTTIIILFVEYPLELNQLVSSIWISLASLGFVYLGYIMVGCLTIRARVFPAWVGWLLLLIGFSYDVIWFFTIYGMADSIPFSIFTSSVLFLRLLEAVALIGYGWNIIKYKIPRKKRTQPNVRPTSRARRVF